MSRPQLQLYLRAGCSLCEAMVLELQPFQKQYQFEINEVDIDTSDELIRLYGDKVPLLSGDNGEICHYFLDSEKLNAYFAIA